jgi:hypothetical protein
VKLACDCGYTELAMETTWRGSKKIYRRLKVTCLRIFRGVAAASVHGVSISQARISFLAAVRCGGVAWPACCGVT